MSSCSFNRQIAREVADKLGVVIVKSHERGIEIRREVCPGGCERHYAIETWIICGGGWIAGNSDVFWLVPVGCVNVQAECACFRSGAWTFQYSSGTGECAAHLVGGCVRSPRSVVVAAVGKAGGSSRRSR